MRLFDCIAEKYADISAKRESACMDAELLVSKTELYISENKNNFIDIQWAIDTKSACEELRANLCSLSTTAILSRSTLNSAKNKLELLFDEVENRIQSHNEIVARSMIAEGRKLVGKVEERELDDQQMACIVKPAHNHLVIAGAGTGKTTTIVGKIKYLLNTGKYKPEDILVLSFTNASAKEMSIRINKETNANITAATFHKLGLGIITKVNGKTPIISRINLAEFSRNKLMELIKDKKYLELICSYFLDNHKYDKTEHDFETKAEYDEYLRLNPPLTLNGEKVKSYGEMDIANFLFKNGINYEYEKEYEVDTRTEEYTQYYPDFYLTDYGIYIEYFGINRDGKVPAYFSQTGDVETATKEYSDGMRWKREVHKNNNTVLIESYAYEKADGMLTDNLKEALQKVGVRFIPLTAEEIWEKVSENNTKDIFSSIADLFATVITLIKSNDYSFEVFKGKCLSAPGGNKNGIIVSLIEPIYKAYEDVLKQNDEIDFNDMINDSAKMVREGLFINPFKCVIVDEYQDISKARFNLLKSLRDTYDYELFCVGDDWQSIYRFAGSDMGYILDFQNFWGPTVISKIETTYRFTKSLINISGSFVMRNPAQIQKSIQGKMSDFGFALGEIKGYTEQIAIRFMIQKLDDLPRDSSVYFIGRYSFDSKLLDDSQEIKCKYDNEHGVVNVSYPKRSDLKMTFMTAHKSKGLQADYVFIINNKQNGLGFPSRIQDEPIVDILLEAHESYPYAEERRLFYVALTRARKKSFIVAVDGNESLFVKELEQRYEREIKQEKFSCPICGNRLVVRTAKSGTNVGQQFYGCSGYPSCKYIRKKA